MRLLAFVFVLSPYVFWLALMPFTRHYDFALINWQAHHINIGHWNLYAYLDQIEQNFAPRGHPVAAYPFGMYLSQSAWIAVLQALGLIDYTTWTTPHVILQSPATVLLLKVPYLATHVAIGIILCRMASPGWRWQAWALWAWSISPAYLLLMGQNDLPVALAMTAAAALCGQALRYRQTRDARWRLFAFAGMALLGAGASYKTAPLILVVPFALMLSPQWRDRVPLIATPVLIFAAVALPFLNTPAFVNGALLNPEGLNLFSQSPVFVQPTSLFIVVYALLSVILLLRRWEAGRPLDFWLVGAGVFSGIFPFIQTAFYWLVWLIPFLIGLIVQDEARRALWMIGWLAIEIAFGVSLLFRHQDLNFGLLTLGSSEFRLLHLEVALHLHWPGLKQVFKLIKDVAQSLQTVAWLLVIGTASSALITPSNRLPWLVRMRRMSVLAAIGILLFSGVGLAALGLWVLRDAKVEGFARRASGQVVLSASQPVVVQSLSPPIQLGHALLLSSQPSSTPVEIYACAHYSDSNTICAQGMPLQTTRFTGYAFKFNEERITEGVTTDRIEFRLADANAESRIDIPLLPLQTRREQHRVTQGDAVQEGVVRMFSLLNVDLAKAVVDIGRRIVGDWQLVPLWCLLLIAIVVLVKRTVAKAPTGQMRSPGGTAAAIITD